MPLLGQKPPCAQWFENVPLCDRRLAKELGGDYMSGVGLTDDPNGHGEWMYMPLKSRQSVSSPLTRSKIPEQKSPIGVSTAENVQNIRRARDWIR